MDEATLTDLLLTIIGAISVWTLTTMRAIEKDVTVIKVTLSDTQRGVVPQLAELDTRMDRVERRLDRIAPVDD